MFKLTAELTGGASTTKNNSVSFTETTPFKAPFTTPTLAFANDAKTLTTTTVVTNAVATTPGFYGWVGALFAQTGTPVQTIYYGKDAAN